MRITKNKLVAAGAGEASGAGGREKSGSRNFNFMKGIDIGWFIMLQVVGDDASIHKGRRQGSGCGGPRT